MKFFDANILYGVPSQRRMYRPISNIETLLSKLQEFGIDKAIVHREEQFFSSPVSSNAQLAADISLIDNLWGIWTMLPPHCNEMPSSGTILSEMKRNRIIGWQFFPGQNQYLFHWRVMKTWFELAEKNRIPLFIDFAFVAERDLLEVMDKYPELTVILRNSNVWPSDRILRPFLSEFPNVYMETSYYLTADGIESLVADGFGKQILFSTHFQEMHVGGPMLMLKHANISESEKSLIAAKNLERILESINYDQ